LESTGEPVVIITRWSCDPEAVPSIVLLNPSTGAVIPNEPVVKCDLRDWEVNQLCDVGPDGQVYATVTQIFTFDQETGILTVSLVRADDPNVPYVQQGQLQTCSPGQLEVEAIQVCGNTAGTFRQLTEMALIDTRDGVIVSTFYIDATGATVALNPGEVLTVGDCYTPSLLGILDELEEVNQNLTDIQTQITTQINLLTQIEENTDGIETLIGTTNTLITQTNGYVDEIEPKLDTINQTLLDVIQAIQDQGNNCCPETNNWLSQIAGYTDGIEGLVTAGNATLVQIAGYTDGIETLITAGNAILTQIAGYVDGLESLLSPSPFASHGQLPVGTTAVQLSAGAAAKGVIVKAHSANTGLVYVGNSNGVTTANGFELGPGDTVTLPVTNSNLIWAIATLAAQRVGWVVV
jgi:conjugal transfer/entry exclusion protein